MRGELGVASVFLLALSAWAKPETALQAAEKARTAFAAKDDAALRALAAQPKPDPWMVVEMLRYLDAPQAAASFAKAAANRPDTTKLPAYVAARTGEAPDEKTRQAASAAIAAFKARRPDRAIGILRDIKVENAGVMTIHACYVRALAYGASRQNESCARELLAVAKRAEAIGWLGRAATAYGRGSFLAHRARRAKLALELSRGHLGVQTARGNEDGQASALNSLGLALYARGALAKAEQCYRRGIALREEQDDPRKLARVLHNLGRLLIKAGRPKEAVPVLNRALPLSEKLGLRKVTTQLLRELGMAYRDASDAERALACCSRSLALAGDERELGLALFGVGQCHSMLGNFRKSLGALDRSGHIAEQLNDHQLAARALNSAGNACQRLGRFDEARRRYRRSLELDKTPRGTGTALGNLGLLHFEEGRYAKALELCERALKLRRDAGLTKGIAASLDNIGAIYLEVGDTKRALDYLTRALALKQELEWRTELPSALAQLGFVHQRLGEHETALGYYERALKAQSPPARRSMILLSRATLLADMGNDAEAASTFQRALALKKEAGTLAGVSACLYGMAQIEGRRKNHARALELYGEAERVAPPVAMVHCGWGRSSTLLQMGEAKRAAEAAKRTVEAMRLLIRGHAGEHGSQVRERFAGVYANGISASVALDDPELCSFFMESGRAGTLLESLGGRNSIGALPLPVDLVNAEAEARAGLVEATERHTRALRLRKLDSLSRTLDELDVARRRLLDVVARIQRASKAAADMAYPEPASLEAIRAILEPGEALVSYALAADSAVALVVEPDRVRIVTLGDRKRIEAATRKLAVGDVAKNPAPALDALRAAVLSPLELRPTTKRLLVSPAGPLTYVPFALLAGKREVAYLPSGTTLGVLRSGRAEPGDGVLALGASGDGLKRSGSSMVPHRDGALLPLPGAREEARLVGDVALLGRGATETALRAALTKRPRWRSIHFACHGLMDPERPLLSSLALAPGKADDGFLTTIEVMRLKIPADLVVLSACETAVGKVYRADGVMGFTRAFMVAGAPRVLVSLWKVDDDATKTLMVKFYEAWKTRSAAAALRLAQEQVASHERWKHPSFWAAWQLWGLPD